MVRRGYCDYVSDGERLGERVMEVMMRREIEEINIGNER